jgi:copper chaperone CopZ
MLKQAEKFMMMLHIAFMLPAGSIIAADAGDVTTEISLPTVQCGMCENTISKALDKVKGVKEYTIDIENKKAFVTYDDGLTSLTKIEKAISKAGYAANERKANKKAYDELHNCCKLPEDR